MKKTLLLSVGISALLLISVQAKASQPLLICEPKDPLATQLDSVMVEGNQASVVLNVGYDDHSVRDFTVSVQHPGDATLLSGNGFSLSLRSLSETAGLPIAGDLTLEGSKDPEQNLRTEVVCRYSK